MSRRLRFLGNACVPHAYLFINHDSLITNMSRKVFVRLFTKNISFLSVY